MKYCILRFQILIHLYLLKIHIRNFDDRIARINNEIKAITKKTDKEIKKDNE